MSREDAITLRGFLVIVFVANFVLSLRATKWSEKKQLRWVPLVFFVQGLLIATILLPWEPQ